MLPIENVINLIEEYQIPIVKIEENRGYWLIRTQSGTFFDEFHLGGFIGVGWNEFNNKQDFLGSSKEATLQRIEAAIEDTQPWRVFTQLQRFFHEIKIGDIVMIPSANSKYIIFGEVTSDVYYEEISEETLEEEDCPFIKRRSVQWIKSVERKSLDPYLYKMMQSHFSISNAKDYADVIDRTLHSYYYKGDKAHLILNVKQQDDIPLVDLLDALNAPLDLVDIINDFEVADTSYNRRDLDAKLRVQSPGIIEFVSSGEAFGLAVFLGVTIVGLVGGNLSFKRSKVDGNQTEGALQSDGLFEKLLKWRQQSHDHKMQEKLLELDDSDIKRLEDAQHKLDRASRTLKMELPTELTTDRRVEINVTDDDTYVIPTIDEEEEQVLEIDLNEEK